MLGSRCRMAEREYRGAIGGDQARNAFHVRCLLVSLSQAQVLG